MFSNIYFVAIPCRILHAHLGFFELVRKLLPRLLQVSKIKVLCKLVRHGPKARVVEQRTGFLIVQVEVG